MHWSEGLSLLYTSPRQNYCDQRGTRIYGQDREGDDFVDLPARARTVERHTQAEQPAYAEIGDYGLLESFAIASQRRLSAIAEPIMAEPPEDYDGSGGSE